MDVRLCECWCGYEDVWVLVCLCVCVGFDLSVCLCGFWCW